MNADERRLLLGLRTVQTKGLSTILAIICILDVFGVFPVVTLPKAIIDCGYSGIVVVLVVCLTQIYTANLLGKCWILAEEIHPAIQRKSRYPYAALAEITYGRKLASYVTFLLDLTIFGGGIPNLIVASENLQLLGLRASGDRIDISYCYWIIIVGTILCPVLWLGSPKDMKWLCSLSTFIVVSVFLLTCSCLLFSEDQSTPTDNFNDEDQPRWPAILRAYGIITFQFDIHPTILTIQVDMNDKSRLPRAVAGGFLPTLLMFGITTLITSVKYGTVTKSSILETLPASIPLHFAAVLVAIQLLLTSAISNSALYQQMEECMGISRDFNPKRCVLRTTLTILAVVIAQSVPKFDLVMSVVGGTLTGPLVFILPPIFYMKILSMQTKYEDRLAMESFTNIVFTKDEQSGNVSKYIEQRFKEDFRPSISFSKRCKYSEKVLCGTIIIVSVVLTLTTTYTNFMNVIVSYSDLTRPCIYNISMALLYL